MFFFFNDTATTEIYTLSLHDALPILDQSELQRLAGQFAALSELAQQACGGLLRKLAKSGELTDRKSTRLNSSHQIISYAVFCLKKKKTTPKWNKTASAQREHRKGRDH